MRIRIFASDANPAIDKFLLKKPVAYCEQEVSEGRARPLKLNDITAGIQLLPSEERVKKAKVERRGSPEAHGLLTAYESQLNSEFRGNLSHIKKIDDQVRMLSRQYEHKLDEHVAKGRRGTPLACAVIAAKVKTILSDPELVRA